LEHPKITVKRSQYRPKNERDALATELLQWRRSRYTKEPLKFIFPEWLILSDKDIQTISQLKPDNMKTVADLIASLSNEPTIQWQDKWASKVFHLVSNWNQKLSKVSTQF
jgi:hypothetical protein